SSSSTFTPFELNYGWLPTTITGLDHPSAYEGVQKYAKQAVENLQIAHDAIIRSRVFQTHYANRKRSPEPEIRRGAWVYLSTQN
ncbi:hypothetical protein BDN72DRAFT_750660, partial [Pluteus cervinus]